MAWNSFESIRLTEWSALVQARAGQLVRKGADPLGQCFAVISRKLGHKHDMPGTGQWVLHTDVMDKETWMPEAPAEDVKESEPEEPPKPSTRTSALTSDSERDKPESEPAKPEEPCWDGLSRLAKKCECWICARKTLTLFFWSKKIGLAHRQRTRMLQSQHRD